MENRQTYRLMGAGEVVEASNSVFDLCEEAGSLLRNGEYEAIELQQWFNDGLFGAGYYTIENIKLED